MIEPPKTARTKPTITYAIAISNPKILASKIKAPKSTNGLEIRNENVTPLDNPALVKPINIGIDEQEQNGVSVPNNAPIVFALTPLNLPNIFLVRSGGKND